MLEREINTLSITDWHKAEQVIERICLKEGLWISLKNTLRQYPGSVHWHFKQAGGNAGVLEITLWPDQNRLWLSVHDSGDAGGDAAWIPDTFERIAAQLAYWL